MEGRARQPPAPLGAPAGRLIRAGPKPSARAPRNRGERAGLFGRSNPPPAALRNGGPSACPAGEPPGCGRLPCPEEPISRVSPARVRPGHSPRQTRRPRRACLRRPALPRPPAYRPRFQGVVWGRGMPCPPPAPAGAGLHAVYNRPHHSGARCPAPPYWRPARPDLPITWP